MQLALANKSIETCWGLTPALLFETFVSRLMEVGFGKTNLVGTDLLWFCQ